MCRESFSRGRSSSSSSQLCFYIAQSRWETARAFKTIAPWLNLNHLFLLLLVRCAIQGPLNHHHHHSTRRWNWNAKINFSYNFIYRLDVHLVATHHYPKDAFRCEHCPKSYCYRPSLLRHRAIVHGEYRKYPCENCSKVSPNSILELLLIVCAPC